MRIPLVILALTIITAHPVFGGSLEDRDCDRSGDRTVTIADAFIALRDAVGNCRTSRVCDSNGDYEPTVTDALLLLRYSVGLDVQLSCDCVYIDQCIHGAGDEDCAEMGFPGFHCFGSICVECIDSSDCSDGQVCDPCKRACSPASQ